MKWNGWARRNGVRLAMQIEGASSAPLLLLLPGQANDHRWWDRLRREFFDDYLTVTFDYRGTGQTRLIEDEQTWTTALFADDAAAVLAATGRGHAHVYGTSMGGRVAQHLALRHPGLVDGLVLACTSAGAPGSPQRSAAVRRSLIDPDERARLRTVFDLFYSPGWIQEHGGYEEAPRDLLGDPTMSVRARHRHLLASDRHDAVDELHLITAPTLVMHGTDDLLVPHENARLLANHIHRSELRLVPSGRHGFFDEHRATIRAPLLDHLAAASGR